MSSAESKESLTYDEVTSWRSDVLKLYCRQRGLKVSGSKQELVAHVFGFTPGIVYFHYRMSTSCIHVTALLLRIEAANRNGPNCMSKECVCTVPAEKTAVQPKQISEMVWKASKLNKGSCTVDFLHGSINKISYLVTHLFNVFLLFG